MDIFASGTLYQLSFWAYIAAGVNYVYVLQSRREQLARYATLLMFVGFLAHTSGLLARWVEAGHVEIAAYEQAASITLTGWAWFEVFVQHPPFTNLYESLVFFAWGMVLVYLFLERRYKVRAFGVGAVMLVIATMGLASLTPGQQIKPLVPALQSWWMHVHVINASIAYPAFLLAAIASFLYLVKVRVAPEKMGIALGVFLVLLMLALGGGTRLITDEFWMIPVFPFQGATERLMYGAQIVQGAGNPKTEQFVLKMQVPYIHAAFTATLIAALAMSLSFGIWVRTRSQLAQKIGSVGAVATVASLALALAAFFVNIATYKNVTFTEEQARALVEADVARRIGDGARVMQFQMASMSDISISLHSNPFVFMMLTVCLVASLLYAFVLFRHESLSRVLPDPELLDRLSNRAILVGYPAISLLLITGMIWAHYSWGRFWGWDPKETWALVTWMLYTGYFHMRVARGWDAKRTAALAVFGFVVVIFTYLGVNLGLTGDGLHSYGSV